MSFAHSHVDKTTLSNPDVDGKGTSDNLEALRKENGELHTALTMSREENALLNDVISTIGSTLKLDEVLSHLVNTVVRATSCHAAFIYLYNKDKDRLAVSYTHLTLPTNREV